MATRRSAKAAASPQVTRVSDLPDFDSAGSITQAPTGALELPGPRAAWTWYASPWDLQVWRGHYRPLFKKANHTPGDNSNALNDYFGQGHGSYLRRLRYLEIPHRAITATAFGTPYVGEQSNYLVRHVRYIPGTTRVHFAYYEHAWRRPIPTPNRLRWEHDAEGFLEFCDKVVEFITNGEGLSAEMKTEACAPAITSARGLLDRNDPRGERLLLDEIANIPEDMRPLDLRRAFARLTADDSALVKS